MGCITIVGMPIPNLRHSIPHVSEYNFYWGNKWIVSSHSQNQQRRWEYTGLSRTMMWEFIFCLITFRFSASYLFFFTLKLGSACCVHEQHTSRSVVIHSEMYYNIPTQHRCRTHTHTHKLSVVVNCVVLFITLHCFFPFFGFSWLSVIASCLFFTGEKQSNKECGVASHAMTIWNDRNGLMRADKSTPRINGWIVIDFELH